MSDVEIQVNDPIYATVSKGLNLIRNPLSYPLTFWRKTHFGNKKPIMRRKFVINGQRIYTGWIPSITQFCKNKNFSLEIKSPNLRITPTYLHPKLPKNDYFTAFRPDQESLIQAALEHQRGYIVAPTGTGKTCVIMGVVKAFEGKKILFLCHSLSIVDKTIKDFEDFKFSTCKLGGGQKAITAQITIATMQTMRSLDLTSLRDFYDVVIIDECLHHSTLISSLDGDKQISQIKVNDFVYNKTGIGKVTATSKKKIPLSRLVKITFSNSKIIISSDNHPFFTKRGLILAKDLLSKEDYIFERIKNVNNNNLRKRRMRERNYSPISFEQTKVLQPILQSKICNVSTAYKRKKLFKRKIRKTETSLEKIEARETRCLCKNEERIFRENEKEQSIKRSESYRENQKYPKNEWNTWIQQLSPEKRRQWTICSGSSTIAIRQNIKSVSFTKLGIRTCSTDQNQKKSRLSDLLQNRYRQSNLKNRYRSRWIQSYLERCRRTRSEETKTFRIVRVENIEIYKRGYNEESFSNFISDSERSRGHIELYDLGIDNHPSFFANGILVHNSHLAMRNFATYEHILNHLSAPVRLGFTATPPQNPERKLIGEGLLGPTIGELTFKEAENLGIMTLPIIEFLCPPISERIKALRIYREIYDEGIVHNRIRNQLIVDRAKEFVEEGKSVLVFSSEKTNEHGDILLEMMEKANIECVYLNGNTPGDIRTHYLEKIEKKILKCAIVTRIWREGVNIKSLDAIIIAKGGKGEIKSGGWESVLQTIGRCLRKSDDKDYAVVVDCLDPYRYLAEHTIERLQVYTKMGWL